MPTIAGELKRHFRDHGWSVRPPRRIPAAGHERRPRGLARDGIEWFITAAVPLASTAVGRALDAARVPPEELGLLAVVSCTGYATPGLDILLTCSEDVLRTRGDCSSATVLMVLEQLAARTARGPGWTVLLAFGPGLTLYASLPHR